MGEGEGGRRLMLRPRGAHAPEGEPLARREVNNSLIIPPTLILPRHGGGGGFFIFVICLGFGICDLGFWTLCALRSALCD
jgi:hypothetical protein